MTTCVMYYCGSVSDHRGRSFNKFNLISENLVETNFFDSHDTYCLNTRLQLFKVHIFRRLLKTQLFSEFRVLVHTVH